MSDWKKHIKELIETDIYRASELIIHAIRSQSLGRELLFKAIVLRQNLISATPAFYEQFREAYYKLFNEIEELNGINLPSYEISLERVPKLPQEKKETIFVGNHLYKKYGQFELVDINVTLKSGEITALIGQNGSGKSTLIKIIAGEITQDSGSIEYPLFDKNKNPKDWFSIKNNIAYIPQELKEWEIPLREALKFEASIHGIRGKENDIAVEYILERLDLRKFLKYNWNELSTGYKVRLALAKALVWSPKLLILDEPLGNLDILAQEKLLSDLRDLANSLKNPISVLISTQHVSEVEEVSDNIIFLKEGQPQYIGSLLGISQYGGENLFSIECMITLSEIQRTFKADKDLKSFMKIGNEILVRASIDITANLFLKKLIDEGIDIISFQDMTNSSKRIFYEK